MKGVLDTNVLLVSISPRSRFRWIFDALLAEKFILCMTTEILLEYGEIIGQHMGHEYYFDTMSILENLPNVEQVTPRFHFNLLSNPDDNKFADCAISANAVCIVSHNRDFLPLRNVGFPRASVVDIEAFRSLLFPLPL